MYNAGGGRTTPGLVEDSLDSYGFGANSALWLRTCLVCFHQLKVILNYVNQLYMKLKKNPRTSQECLCIMKGHLVLEEITQAADREQTFQNRQKGWSLQHNILSYFHIISLFSTWNPKMIRHCSLCLGTIHTVEFSCAPSYVE